MRGNAPSGLLGFVMFYAGKCMWLCFLVKKERLISCTTESPVASKQYETRHCTTILWDLITKSDKIWPELKTIINMYVE